MAAATPSPRSRRSLGGSPVHISPGLSKAAAFEEDFLFNAPQELVRRGGGGGSGGGGAGKCLPAPPLGGSPLGP